jgi:predicted AAA+ superfamily ATPase
MQAIATADIIRRIRLENPWWETAVIDDAHRGYNPRAYFDLFLPLIQTLSVRRAIVLMGPRRVGKTVMIHHAIQALLDQGQPPKSICYFSVDHPIYNGLSLEQLLDHYRQSSGVDYAAEQIYVFFDEIQYLRRWEEHLKALVDTHANIKSIVSGSSAAALRLKSNESGAGRLTDLSLAPADLLRVPASSWQNGSPGAAVRRAVRATLLCR